MNTYAFNWLKFNFTIFGHTRSSLGKYRHDSEEGMWATGYVLETCGANKSIYVFIL